MDTAKKFNLEKTHTIEDIRALPDGKRAELIDGHLYAMAPPGRIHQKLEGELYYIIKDYIKSNNGSCDIYPAPFAVNLDAEDKNWVEPDISVICDPDGRDVYSGAGNEGL